MKKILLFILIISTIFILISCKAPDDKEDKEQESSSIGLTFRN